MDPMDAARARLDAHMADRGLKRTRQREVILEAFLSAGRHLSVDDLLILVQGKMAGVGAATVYRSLKLFAEAGIADERHFQDGQTRYEPALGIDHHDHLICTDCGRIFEFEDPVIEQRQAEVCRERGMVLQSHRHEIYASCADPSNCAFRSAN
jgi:Fur family transcriptional regulator, ferric uptake regulator